MIEINAVVFPKGNERYIFIYEDGRRGEVMATLARFAANPELSLTWYDTAIINQAMPRENKRICF